MTRNVRFLRLSSVTVWSLASGPTVLEAQAGPYELKKGGVFLFPGCPLSVADAGSGSNEYGSATLDKILTHLSSAPDTRPSSFTLYTS